MPSSTYLRPLPSRVRTAALGLLPLLALACAASPDPARYRLAESGNQWEMVGEDRILNDVQRRYPEFFAVILDPTTSHEPDLRPIREDIERHPIDRRNYDALNAIAIAYFELNARAEADRGGSNYLSDSFRSARLVAIPWRAYGEVENGALRNAILDFFEDAASGEKLHSGATASRLTRIVSSLERKESDGARRERIRIIVETLQSRMPEPGP